MERRDLLAGALGLGAVVMCRPVIEILEGLTVPPPGVVGMTDVNRLRRLTMQIRELDSAFGGCAVRDQGRLLSSLDDEGRASPTPPTPMTEPAWRNTQAAQTLAWADSLLGGSMRQTVRTKLHHRAAWLGEEIGFAAWDSGDNVTARQCWIWALAVLGEASSNENNRSLEVRIYASLARQASWANEHKEAMAYANSAIGASRGLEPVPRALAWATWARVNARAGERNQTLSGIKAADEAFRETDDGPVWVAFSTDPTYLADTGHALCDLVIGGHHDLADEAEERQCLAIGTFSADTHARTLALAQAIEASTYMAIGEPEEGIRVGTEALGAAATLQSRRLRRSVSELSDVAKNYNRSDVSDFREQISETLAA